MTERNEFFGCPRCSGRGYVLTLLRADSERAVRFCPFCGWGLAYKPTAPRRPRFSRRAPTAGKV